MSGLIVAGMHHSGTSVVTALLERAGWHPGEVLVEQVESATREFKEDAAFVALHREWLKADVPATVVHADWGASHAGSPGPRRPPDGTARCRDFAARRDRQREQWVAKDPRAALYLQEWAAIPQVRFVLVYRSPWDNVDSILRLGREPFVSDPALIRATWLQYNRALVRFAASCPERCVVVATEAILRQPSLLPRLLAAQDPEDLAGVVDPRKFAVRGSGTPIAGLYRALHPECAELLDDLDALADAARPAPIRDRTSCVVPGGTLAPGTGVQVVIPCRDDGAFIDEAIASVEAAAHEPTELTIVDDGSSDPETVRVMDGLRRAGYHVVTTPGVGLSAARNAGSALSRTAVVVPLDADNRIRPALLEGARLVAGDEADIVHGPWQEFGLRTGVRTPPEASWPTLFPHNSIDACAAIGRRLLDEVGGWDPDLPFWEDWDLWIGSLERQARFFRIEQVTFDYLVRPGSILHGVQARPGQRLATLCRIAAKHQTALEPFAGALAERIADDASGIDREIALLQREAAGLASALTEHRTRPSKALAVLRATLVPALAARVRR